MTQEKDQDSTKVSLEEKIAEWDTKVDEAKVQLSLAGMEAEDALRPHVETLDNEMAEAKSKLHQLAEASESSWGDIKAGLDLSLEAMSEAFDSARKHFDDNKGKKKP